MNHWTHKWDERIEGEKTIRNTTYRDARLEVTAQEIGTQGDFVATILRVDPHGAPDRSGPHWGKSPEEALGRACRSALQQVDADR